MFGLIYKIQLLEFGFCPLFDPKCRVVALLFSISKMQCLWFHELWNGDLNFCLQRWETSTAGVRIYGDGYRFTKAVGSMVLNHGSFVGYCCSSWSTITGFADKTRWKWKQRQMTGLFWDNYCL